MNTSRFNRNNIKHDYAQEFEMPNDNDPLFVEWVNRYLESTAPRRNLPALSNFRVWETVTYRNLEGKVRSIQFKIISYNVLAQYLLESQAYKYIDCTNHDLRWDIRASRLYNEIISYSPDILCLQEVQTSYLNSFYSKFEEIGFQMILKQKPGNKEEGCAILFKTSVFELKDQISVEFYQPQLPILDRDNVGLMLKLSPWDVPDTAVVVATAHLLSDPTRTDVRLAQMKLFLAEIDRFSYYNNEKTSGHLPMIITGDFNATPENIVIQLLERGMVCASRYRGRSDWESIGVTDNCQHLSVYLNRKEGRPTPFMDIKIYHSELCLTRPKLWEQWPAQKENFKKMFNTDYVGHSLKFLSVYENKDGNEATTYLDGWVTVDYMYFGCHRALRLLERLRLPTSTQCEKLGQLPNHIYGSDHLALGAVFELLSFT